MSDEANFFYTFLGLYDDGMLNAMKQNPGTGVFLNAVWMNRNMLSLPLFH